MQNKTTPTDKEKLEELMLLAEAHPLFKGHSLDLPAHNFRIYIDELALLRKDPLQDTYFNIQLDNVEVMHSSTYVSVSLKLLNTNGNILMFDLNSFYVDVKKVLLDRPKPINQTLFDKIKESLKTI